MIGFDRSEDVPQIAELPLYADPHTMAKYWGFPTLYPWQERIVAEASKPKAFVSGSFPNSAGKTSIILPLLGLTVMSAFPGSTVYTTAGSEAQLKDQLFKTLASRVRPFEKVGWKVNASDLSVTAPRVRGLPPSKWISRVPRNALTAEGYHSSVERDQYGKWHYCPLFCAIDEAKSVEDEVFEMMYRLIPDWMLVISTPDLDTGPFYRAVDPEGMKPESPGVEIV